MASCLLRAFEGTACKSAPGYCCIGLRTLLTILKRARFAVYPKMHGCAFCVSLDKSRPDSTYSQNLVNASEKRFETKSNLPCRTTHHSGSLVNSGTSSQSPCERYSNDRPIRLPGRINRHNIRTRIHRRKHR